MTKRDDERPEEAKSMRGHRARAEWFARPRRGPDGIADTGVIAHAIAQRRAMEEAARNKGPDGPPRPPSPPGPPGSVNWTSIGPSVIQNLVIGPVTGRVRSLAVGPQSPNGARAYAGAANGGVWLTNDGGATWTPLYPYQTTTPQGTAADSLSVGAIAVRFGATAAADVLFVGTGEPAGGDAYLGIGILSSTNGGASVAVEGTNLANRAVWRLALDPSNPAIVYAATSTGLYQRPLTAPFTTWTQITSTAFTDAAGQATDVLVAGTFVYAAFYGDAVYRFDGTSWTKLTGLVAQAGPLSLRIALAACESDPTAVYALVGQTSATLYKLAGTAFQAVTATPPVVTDQGFYDLTIAVGPTDPTEVYLGGNAQSGGASLFKGHVVSGSFGFTNVANPSADPTFVGAGVHADVHAVAFALNASGTAHTPSEVWVGCDGGVYRSTSSGAAGTFAPATKGISIVQPTRLGQRPDTDAVVFLGCQDNSSVRLDAGQVATIGAGVGDGGGAAVDANDPNRIVVEGKGALYGATDGGQTTASWTAMPFPPVGSAEQSRRAQYAPVVTSPAGGETRIAFGTHRVWICRASLGWGTSWVTIPTGTNPYAVTPADLDQDRLDATNTGVTALVFGSPTRLFVTNGTGVWMFDVDASNNWTRTALTTNGLPSPHYILSIAVADSAAAKIYVTLGFSPSAIWYLDGSGATAWTDCALVDSTSAPIRVPARASVVDPLAASTVYVGTDVGCFRGTKSLATPPTWSWSAHSDGLPESSIVDLAIHERARLLRAVTHGRGVWEIELDGATAPSDPDVYLRVNCADTGRLPSGQRFPWVEGAADPTAPGRTVYHWMSADIKVRRPMLTGLPPLGSSADYYDFSVNIGDYVQPSTNTETADLGGTIDRVFVEVHNRGATAIAAGGVRVLLLLTDASAGLPALPVGYAQVLRTGVVPTNWLAGTGWYFADPGTVFRTTPGVLDVRTPQVVEYGVDFGSLALPANHDHVCAAAFVSTVGPGDQIASTQTEPSLDTLTMRDKHVAHRNLHLVLATARPLSRVGGGFDHSRETFVVDFNNPHPKRTVVDLVFRREGFSGELSLVLPRLALVSKDDAFRDWKVLTRPGGRLRSHLARWLERVGEAVEHAGEKLERLGRDLAALDDEREAPPSSKRPRTQRRLDLDPSRAYVAGPQDVARVRGVLLEPHQRISAAVTVRPQASAAPGDKLVLHVIQQSEGRIVGGSSYVIAVVEAR